MTKRSRSIDKRKVRSVIVWSLLLIAIAALQYGAVGRKADTDLSKVMISINKQDVDQYLIKQADVVSLIEQDLGYALAAVQLRDLDLRRIEDLLAKDDRVARSEIYLDSDDILHIYVLQRKPIARIKGSAVDYYIDNAGHTVQVQDARPVRVPIVTGISTDLPDGFPDNKQRSILNDVYEIAMAAAGDEFLSALVEQIHVDDREEVWIIPKIGDERLLIGDAAELDDRLSRLKIVYREGMQQSGFNQYAELHFKWKGQVTRVKK